MHVFGEWEEAGIPRKKTKKQNTNAGKTCIQEASFFSQNLFAVVTGGYRLSRWPNDLVVMHLATHPKSCNIVKPSRK